MHELKKDRLQVEGVQTSPSIDILYITHNRLKYTQKTLPALIENAGIPFRLVIFDNGSTDGTGEYLQEIESAYPDVVDCVFLNEENIGISMPTNIFWKRSQADYVGKVDNDTLLPRNWLAYLLDAHQKSENLGVIGGFHFNMGYFKPGELEKRVISAGNVQIIPDAFIGGCCYIMPRRIQQEVGLLKVTPDKKTYGWTEYQKKILHKGYINGYLYPLLLVEHFDDPLSVHNLLFTDFLETSQISLADKNIPSDKESMRLWYAKDAARMSSGESLCAENAMHLLPSKQQDKFSSKPLKAILTEAEMELFLRCIPTGKTVLEFGSGGSTKLFIEGGVKKLYSVESDPDWIKHMMSDDVIQNSMQDGRLSFLYANIGPIRAYGLPADPAPNVIWLRYHREVWSAIVADEVSHVLVDGRFRVACVLQCFLRCRKETSIYIHDFNNRPQYHVLLNFIDIVESADSAILCRIKPNANFKEIALTLQQYDLDKE